MSQKAMIALSGGVDSSLAAILTAKEGFDCVGATMVLFRNSSVAGEAGSVARALGIPFYTFDFSDFFRSSVIAPFAEAYCCGRTPNPCVACNRSLKFGRLLLAAGELSCDVIVTGHYARVAFDEDRGRYLLKKGVDMAKDQSYFLYALSQEQLARIRFPLGEMHKSEVRRMAEEAGLPSANRQESQDICFVPDGNYTGVIEQYTGLSFPSGNFVDRDGHVLGTHKGIIHYTVGQRKGLGVAFGEPRYVLGVNPADNTVVLGPDEALYADSLDADHLNLISCDRMEGPMRVKARIRSRHQGAWASVTQTDDDRIRVVFDEPQRAITPGQAVVLYDGDLVVGGATIV